MRDIFQQSRISFKWLAASAAMIFFTACTKELGLGNDFVDGDRLNVVFTDTTTIKTSTVSIDSVVALQSGLFRSSLFVGNYTDPVYGKSTAEIYAQITPTTASVPDFTKLVRIDSVWFTLAYDSSKCVGDFNQDFTLELYKLEDTIAYKTAASTGSIAVYSNQRTRSTATPLEDTTFKPNLSLQSRGIVDTSELLNIIRMRLDTNYGRSLMKNLSDFGATDFQTKNKGIRLRARGNTGAMLNFNLLNTNGSRMHVFYKYLDTTVKSARYDFAFAGSVRHNYFEHDRTGSAYRANIQGGEMAGDTTIFTETFNGSDIKVRLPFIKNLAKNGRIAINKAELEVTVDEQISSPVKPVNVLLTLRRSATDTVYVAVADLADAASYEGVLTPTAVNGVTVKKYKINIATHIQSIIDGKEPPEFFLVAENKASTFARNRIFGPKSTKYPLKLNITYTKTQ